MQSARAVGLGDTIGSIAPDGRADIILVDLTDPHTQRCPNPPSPEFLH